MPHDIMVNHGTYVSLYPTQNGVVAQWHAVAELEGSMEAISL